MAIPEALVKSDLVRWQSAGAIGRQVGTATQPGTRRGRALLIVAERGRPPPGECPIRRFGSFKCIMMHSNTIEASSRSLPGFAGHTLCR